MTFERLLVWRDDKPRPGPENMAVDEWLLESAREPVLRLYEWEGDWVSLGYFAKLHEARSAVRDANVKFVRRATGGGVVDHRTDRTYSLVVPRHHELARARGAESYRLIHEAVAAAMQSDGTEVKMLERNREGDSAACFEKPVAWDLVGANGAKLAGAGQRRTRNGLLHQGSVHGLDLPRWLQLATHLAAERRELDLRPDDAAVGALVREKYGAIPWLERR